MACCSLGGITYAEQRSFQYDRVDQQLAPRSWASAHRLDQETGGPPGDTGTPGSIGVAAAARLRHPAGTYGEKRDAGGSVLAAKPFAVDGTVTAKPDLPAQVPVGAPFTVDGQKGAGTRYRALAVRNPMDRGITIAAYR